jgi:hypothetical protein
MKGMNWIIFMALFKQLKGEGLFFMLSLIDRKEMK